MIFIFSFSKKVKYVRKIVVEETENPVFLEVAKSVGCETFVARFSLEILRRNICRASSFFSVFHLFQNVKDIIVVHRERHGIRISRSFQTSANGHWPNFLRHELNIHFSLRSAPSYPNFVHHTLS